MAVAASNSLTFPLFSALPPELRTQIWDYALLETVKPAFHFYNKDCWLPRSPPEAWDYDVDDGSNFEFRFDLLAKVPCEVPHYFVNHEARRAALAWVRRQNVIELCQHEEAERQYPVFVQAFDPKHDALYVPFNEWVEFHDERVYGYRPPPLGARCIAAPESLFCCKENVNQLGVYKHLSNTRTLLVVADAVGGIQPSDEYSIVQQWWWEIDEVPRGGAFVWSEDHFGFVGVRRDGHKRLYRRIEEGIEGLGEGLFREHVSQFEVRPIFPVRR